MRRIWLYAIGALLVIAAVGGIILALANSREHGDTTMTAGEPQNNSASVAFPKREACQIFTLADAKKVLGDSAKGGASGPASSSDALSVSACTYTKDSGNNVPVSANRSASLLVRAPKSGAGTTSNQNQFGPAKPADSQPVTGYGDTAYWDPQNGQLNILKHNSWYTLSNGPVTPTDRSLDQAKALADLLINKM